MSGFIGVYQLFKSIELAFGVAMNQGQRQTLINAMLPLSKVFNPPRESIAQALRKLPDDFYTQTGLNREDFTRFMLNYLAKNLRDMV